MAVKQTPLGDAGVLILDNYGKVKQGVELLTDESVFVGFPAPKTMRKEGGPITNASLGYIHEHGAPEVHIPARPFLKPGIKSVEDEITSELRKAAIAALAGNTDIVERRFERVGTLARDAAKRKISEGIPPPLAASTIRGRLRRVKGAARLRKIEQARSQGVAWSRQRGEEGIFTPLIVTGQLRNAISYEVRKAKK